MSGYSRKEVADSYFAESAVHKKASDSNKREQHDENKFDHREIQHDTPVQNCALSDIKISNVCSLSETDIHCNSSVTQNDWKLLSESDVKHKPLDSSSASESSNKSDCNVRELGTWISENRSTTVDVQKAKNLNESTFIDLTGEGWCVSNEPKLSLTPTVSAPVSKFSRITTRSITCSQSTGVETLTGNPDEQKRSNSSVGQSIVPSDNKSKPDTEGDIEYKSSNKKFCCVLSWTASIYGQQCQCPCALAESTTSQDYIPHSPASVKQVSLHIQSCKDYVLIKDLDSSRTVQKQATSPPNVNTQGQFKLSLDKSQKSNGKSEGHILNKEKKQTNYLRKRSGVGQKKSQVHEFSKGKNRNSKGKRESMLNSVSAIQTCGESRANLLDKQEKAGISHTRNVLNVTPGQKSLTGLKDDYEKRLIPSKQSKCVRKKGTPYIHSKQSDFGEVSVHKKCGTFVHCQNTGAKANNEPYRQSLTHEVQEYPSDWTEPMSEKLRHLELDKHDINPDCSEVINQNDCSNERINKSPDNMEDVMKQREHKSLLSQDGSGYVPFGAMLSDNVTEDKAEKIQNNTHSKAFCCMLGWLAQVCREQSKCSCSLASSTANSTLRATKANTRHRGKKKQNDVLPLHNKKTTKPPSSEIINPQEPVHNLMCVSNTAVEDEQNTFVKKRGLDTFPKSNCSDTCKNTISSEKASEIFSSAESGRKDPLPSACDMSAQDTSNLVVHIRKVKEHQHKLKKQTKGKNQFIPSETKKSPATSIKKAYNLRQDTWNISPLKTSELPPSPKSRPKCCFLCDKNDQKTKNYRSLQTATKGNKDQVVKSSQKLLLGKQSSFISPSKTHSKRSNLELQTKIEISKHDECIVKYSNDFTPAVQETKGNDEYEKCVQKLGNKDQLGQGKRHRQRQKRKSMIPGSESDSAKRRKATQSKQHASPAEKRPTEIALATCDAAVKTPDASSGLKGQSNLQEKIILKQCVLKLYRLPFPLDGKFPIYNPLDTSDNCKVEAKADTEQREK